MWPTAYRTPAGTSSTLQQRPERIRVLSEAGSGVDPCRLFVGRNCTDSRGGKRKAIVWFGPPAQPTIKALWLVMCVCVCVCGKYVRSNKVNHFCCFFLPLNVYVMFMFYHSCKPESLKTLTLLYSSPSSNVNVLIFPLCFLNSDVEMSFLCPSDALCPCLNGGWWGFLWHLLFFFSKDTHS